MILIASNGSETSNKIRDFLSHRALDVKVASLDDFPGEVKGDVELVIYDTDELLEKDILNIALAKKKGIPLVLVVPYLKENALNEISRLWKGNYLKDCLIKPIKIDDFLKYVPEKGSLEHKESERKEVKKGSINP